eukprot:1409823-Alexandrium_andersonii.AAC.1
MPGGSGHGDGAHSSSSSDSDDSDGGGAGEPPQFEQGDTAQEEMGANPSQRPQTNVEELTPPQTPRDLVRLAEEDPASPDRDVPGSPPKRTRIAAVADSLEFDWAEKVQKGKMKEFEMLEGFDAYDVIDKKDIPAGADYFDTTWVIRPKEGEARCRLCCRDYNTGQKED